MKNAQWARKIAESRKKSGEIMKKCAIYCRVSTEEQQKNGLSMDAQLKSLEKYASENNMTIIGRYLDGGKSARGRYTKRPEFMRLLSDVKAGKIDTIIFIKLDRWFRNIADYYEVQKILDSNNVTWQTTQEDYETVTASGRLKVNIMLSVAQDEADRTSERIKFVMQGKRERNEPVSGSVPKGYKIENKKVVKDPALEDSIRKAFEMFMQTGSQSKVIQAFPELKLDMVKAQRFFFNPAYKGDFSGIHIPPYLSEEEFDKILSMKGTVVRKVKHNRVYLFSGLLFCPVCGGRLAGKYETRHNEYPYYSCSNHSQKRGCTNKKIYREDYIENYLLHHIEGKIESLLTVKKSPAKSHQPERDAVKRKLSKLSDLYINDMISMADYKRQYDILTAEQEAIPDDEPQLNIDAMQQKFFPNWQSIYSELSLDSKQSFWRQSIRRIDLNTDGTIDDFDLL